eukprot:Skav226622  [mRNA]  locus=scaffold2041:341612:343300:- [translate_table: standard]
MRPLTTQTTCKLVDIAGKATAMDKNEMGANAVQGDLLDFDTPSSTPKGSGSEPLPLVAVPDGPSPPRRQQVSMPPQDGYLGTSSPERTLWPGDLVLAKCQWGGCAS